MSKLDDIYDQWLVHDEDCDYSLTDRPESCNCIQKNVKANLTKETKALFLEQLRKVGGMNSVDATLAIIAKRIEDL